MAMRGGEEPHKTVKYLKRCPNLVVCLRHKCSGNAVCVCACKSARGDEGS